MNKLKRVNTSSVEELRAWLSKHPDQHERVMVVTHSEVSHPNYVSREEVRDALAAYGWVVEQRVTQNASLIGHVIKKSQD